MHGYTLGQKDGTNALWDKKDVGTLQDRRKGCGYTIGQKGCRTEGRVGVHFGTERWHQSTMGQKGCGYTMGQKGCRTEGKMCMGTLWDRKMAPMHYGTKRMWVHYRTEGRMWVHYRTEGRMWVHYGTEGKAEGTLWDRRKGRGTLWDRRKGRGTL